MKTLEDRISEKISKTYGEDSFKLSNDSHKHSGHAGDDGSGQTHFTLTITSDAFNGMSRIDCQRQVYSLLSQEFQDGLHALALKLRQP
jgi:BolA protein